MKKQLISEAKKAHRSPEQTQKKRINPEQRHPAPRLFAGITGATPLPSFFPVSRNKQTINHGRLDTVDCSDSPSLHTWSGEMAISLGNRGK